MERLTERDEYGNADIIALSDRMPDIYFNLDISGINTLTDTLNRLAAYEDTGLTPEEVEALKAFKAYFDDMYGKGLEVANWHMNGNLEPFDNFYENACTEIKTG